MDSTTELDLRLEEIETEIGDLDDKIQYWHRQKDSVELQRQRLDPSDRKEDERLQKVAKQLAEHILEASIRKAHLAAVADQIGDQLRQLINEGLDESRSPQVDDEVKVELKPKKPKPKM